MIPAFLTGPPCHTHRQRGKLPMHCPPPPSTPFPACLHCKQNLYQFFGVYPCNEKARDQDMPDLDLGRNLKLCSDDSSWINRLSSRKSER